MTVSGALPVGALPVAPPPVAPPRTGAAASATGPSAAAREAATAASAARAFERVLLEQLTTQLAATAAPEDDASAATAAYRDMLPAAMAEALSAAGGIGIATQMATATGVVPAGTTARTAPTTDGSTP